MLHNANTIFLEKNIKIQGSCTFVAHSFYVDFCAFWHTFLNFVLCLGNGQVLLETLDTELYDTDLLVTKPLSTEQLGIEPFDTEPLVTKLLGTDSLSY